MVRTSLTVAVATCGRPDDLRRCLDALAAGTEVPDELVVVDQAPTPAARDAVERCGIPAARYLEQERRGLSASRNLALRTATGTHLAVTDDDCVPDPDWVATLRRVLAGDAAPDAVSGAILPLGPRPAGGHAVSLRDATVAVDHTGRVVPWHVGSGANFAAPRATLQQAGGWDERLGTGTPSRAAEDIELLDRLLRGGATVRYEPAAVVRHGWQDRAKRLATRWSYGHGIGTFLVLRAADRDRFALTMLRAYVGLHLGPLARALAARDLATAHERARALVGLVTGAVHGLALVRRA